MCRRFLQAHRRTTGTTRGALRRKWKTNRCTRAPSPHWPGNAEEKCLALLVCDDANPFQDKAIAVFIDGQLVGYLSHNDALRLRRNLGRMDLVGQLTSCDAVIRGGGLWNGKRLSYAVWLDLQPYN
jgi:hypothetical protein